MHINEYNKLSKQDKEKVTEALESELEANKDKNYVELSPQNSELLGSAVYNVLNMLKAKANDKNNNKPK